MIKLSNRLRTIQSLVPINATILDVGCDHGLLDISIYQNNISKKKGFCDSFAKALKIYFDTDSIKLTIVSIELFNLLFVIALI